MTNLELKYHLACTDRLGEVLSPAQLEMMQGFISLAATNEAGIGKLFGVSPSTARNQVNHIHRKVGAALPNDVDYRLLGKPDLIRVALKSGLTRVVKEEMIQPDQNLVKFTGRRKKLVLRPDAQPQLGEAHSNIIGALVNTEFSGAGNLAHELGLSDSTVRNAMCVLGRSLFRDIVGEEPSGYVDKRWMTLALIATGKIGIESK